MRVSKIETPKLIYEGSVKRVLKPSHDDKHLWFEFTDDYSVFDWGKMPDTIANKGRALTIIGAYFFEVLSHQNFWHKVRSTWGTSGEAPHGFDQQWLLERFAHPVFRNLEKHGLQSHFLRLTADGSQNLSLQEAAKESGPVRMEVVKAEVTHPLPGVVLGQPVFEYLKAENPFSPQLVPLEVVFRFGMPAGSSLKSRLAKDPGYARLLGLDSVPDEGQWFPRPVLEFFSKLEAKDRLLSVQEALTISGLTMEAFQEMSELAYDLALALFYIFGEKGIELWDGKFEFVSDNGRLLLADSIGPDELRLIYKDCQLSKEMIRQVYRGSTWETFLQQAQKLAVERQSHDWKSICVDELKAQPAPLSPAFKALIDQMYGALTNHVTSETIFVNQLDLDSFVASLESGKKR